MKFVKANYICYVERLLLFFFNNFAADLLNCRPNYTQWERVCVWNNLSHVIVYSICYSVHVRLI